MIEEGKFGVQEAIYLSTIAISAKVFFSSPAMLVTLVGNAGWYMTILSGATACLGFFFVHRLLRRFPGHDIAEAFELSLGRALGFAFTGILALYMLFVSITRLAEFGEVLKVYVFPLSPNFYIVGIAIACVYVLSALGLESMARVSKLTIYTMLAGFVLVLALGLQNYDFDNLFPILGNGIGPTVKHGIVRCSVYGEVIILAIFAKTFQGAGYIKKEGFISIGFFGPADLLLPLAFALTFPYYTAQNVTAPMYEMATLVDYGRFIQRVEPLFLFIWIISTLVSVAVVFYAFTFLFCKMFRIQDQKPILLSGIIILYAGALLHKDIGSVIFGNVQFIRHAGAIPTFLLPIFSLAIATIQKKGGKSHA